MGNPHLAGPALFLADKAEEISDIFAHGATTRNPFTGEVSKFKGLAGEISDRAEKHVTKLLKKIGMPADSPELRAARKASDSAAQKKHNEEVATAWVRKAIEQAQQNKTKVPVGQVTSVAGRLNKIAPIHESLLRQSRMEAIAETDPEVEQLVRRNAETDPGERLTRDERIEEALQEAIDKDKRFEMNYLEAKKFMARKDIDPRSQKAIDAMNTITLNEFRNDPKFQEANKAVSSKWFGQDSEEGYLPRKRNIFGRLLGGAETNEFISRPVHEQAVERVMQMDNPDDNPRTKLLKQVAHGANLSSEDKFRLLRQLDKQLGNYGKKYMDIARQIVYNAYGGR